MRDQRARGAQVWLRQKIVDVDSVAVHLDALGDQRVAERRYKNAVGLSTDAVRANGAAFAGIWPLTMTRDEPGSRCRVSRPVPTPQLSAVDCRPAGRCLQGAPES